MRRTVVPATALTIAIVMAGCSDPDTNGEPDPEPTTTDETTSPAEAEDPPDSEATSPDSEEDDQVGPETDDEQVDLTEFSTETQQGSEQYADAALVEYLVDVRVGEHEGYDRVVLEFSGEEAPDVYTVSWAENPTFGQTDDALDVSSDAILEVAVTGLVSTENPEASQPEEIGAIEYTNAPLAIHTTAIVTDVWAASWYQNTGTYYIELDRERPFRVVNDTDPSRLVIDLAHD